MLHPDPEFIHLSKILKYKLDSIHDSISITAGRKRQFVKGKMKIRSSFIVKNITSTQNIKDKKTKPSEAEG